ncbi:hypothetical protein JW859_10120 [bacterium]|nr:hypothetical protein [bacterium]
MKDTLLAVILTAVFVAGLFTYAFAQEDSVPCGSSLVAADIYSPDYSGRSQDGHSIIDTGTLIAQLGINYYRRIKGHWPSSWAEVAELGLAPRYLEGWKGELIDPDNADLSFYGDFYYDATVKPNGEARLVQYSNSDGLTTWYVPLKPTPTYADFFPAMDSVAPQCAVPCEKLPVFSSYLDDENRLVYFGMLGMMSHGIKLFKKLYNRPPYNIEELFDSGLCGITRETINPLTGKPFYGDAREYDVFYDYLDDTRFKLTHIEENGRIPNYAFSY